VVRVKFRVDGSSPNCCLAKRGHYENKEIEYKTMRSVVVQRLKHSMTGDHGAISQWGVNSHELSDINTAGKMFPTFQPPRCEKDYLNFVEQLIDLRRKVYRAPLTFPHTLSVADQCTHPGPPQGRTETV
jgi:hypothetical protein